MLGRADHTHLEQDLTRFRPDIVIIDPALPGCDRRTLLGTVRARSTADAVVLTSPADTLAYVTVLLQRAAQTRTRITVGDMTIDVEAGIAQRDGHTIALTATEFKLLTYFARHRDRVLSKTQILTGVWGYDNYDPNLVEVNVSAVRRKIERYGPRLLHTVRGLGYILRTEM